MKPTTIEVGPGAIIRIGETTLCVRRWESSDSVVARDLESSTDRVVRLIEISESLAKQHTGDQLDLDGIDDSEWETAFRRYQALRHLTEAPSRTRAEVSQVAQTLEVSVATVYRWLDRLARFGRVTCLLRRERKDKGAKKLDPPVDKIVKEVIGTEYLTNLRRSPTLTLREVQRRCRAANLSQPSKSTLLRRIDELLPEERERRRNGRNAALDHRANRGSLPGVDQLHSIWQIDHTLVDIELVDVKDRISIGRPWITVAIDVFSRTVVGWYISFDPPGTLATGICISNAILPKDSILAKLGISFAWPCQGKPRVIQADNAKEFRGNTLKNACAEHGVDLKFRKVKKPNYGAHIERLLGTLLLEIHGLEGTTFSNPQEKGEYDAEKHANMTLDDFERWLANLILGAYHHRPHSTLNCAPIKRYHDGIFGDDLTPGIGMLPVAADPEKLRIDFLPMEERTIQPYGVVLDYICYHDPVLDKWIGATDPKTKKLKRKFIFRRDPRNISYLLFWDPDVRRYYTIPYRDITHPAISLWELREIQKFLAQRGKDEINEKVVFDAFDEMRRIEESARTLTKKQRRGQERRRRHRVAVPSVSPRSRDAQFAQAIDSDLPLAPQELAEPSLDLSDLRPFDEVEPV